MSEFLVTKTIPKKELREYKFYIGFLFKNDNGVFNICTTEEDVMKSNQYFGNMPLKTIIVNKDKIEIGDRFLAICNNQELHSKVFTYLGIANIGEGLITIEADDKNKITTTPQLLASSYKFVRRATKEDKERLVNGKITEYAV